MHPRSRSSGSTWRVRSAVWNKYDLRTKEVDASAQTLLEFVRKIDTTTCGEPSVLAVVTATGLAYRRRDGVHVIPVGTLGP
jgi:hypothetical protein